MRIVRVWVFAVIIIFTVSLGWYVSQPVIFGVARSLNASIAGGQGANVATAVEYASIAWGPLLIIFVLLWAVYASQQRDVESEVYRY